MDIKQFTDQCQRVYENLDRLREYQKTSASRTQTASAGSAGGVATSSYSIPNIDNLTNDFHQFLTWARSNPDMVTAGLSSSPPSSRS